jgi:arylsulfatase A-like enzyme
LDSVSLVPTLTEQGEQPKHEFLYWEFHEGGFKQAVLWEGRWKGIRSGGPERTVRLHDLKNDVAEQKDVAAEHPVVARRLGEYLLTERTESADWKPVWQAGQGKKQNPKKK